MKFEPDATGGAGDAALGGGRVSAATRALAHDQALAAARSQAESAELDAAAARAQRWPTVAVDGGYTTGK